MSEETTFYSVLTKSLLILNFISVLFTFSVIFIYAFIEYVGLNVLEIAENTFGTSSQWYSAIVSLFEILLEIPGGLDTLFLAIIVLGIFNLFYFAYKTEKGGWLGFFFFLSVGLPLWLFLANKIVDLRNTVLNYLNSTLLIKPETTFFDYFTMYSLEFSAVVFILAVIVHMIDWENVREKISSGFNKSSVDETVEERFEQ